MSYSFIPLACVECDDSLPFSGDSSIPLCYVLFPATLLHQLFFNPLSPHLAIYFLVYLSVLLFPNSCIIPFWELYFLPFFCTCPNQHNLFNLIVSIIVGFSTLAYISLLINILQFSFSLSYTGPKILVYTLLSKMFNCFVSLFVSVQVSYAYVNDLSIFVFFSHNVSFFGIFLFLKIYLIVKKNVNYKCHTLLLKKMED